MMIKNNENHDYLRALIAEQKAGKPVGICSICSSNHLVIEAAMEIARDNNDVLLIEATANQVNQYGGYTGMQPADFVTYVKKLAKKIGLPWNQIILGGDHLGPLTWTNDIEEVAMEKAEILVAAYVKAGFSKIHLDTSMRVADDSKAERLSDATIAKRAARLCAVAEENVQAGNAPSYVIGSEVPIPGGATENEDTLAITSPADLEATIGVFKDTFASANLVDAWSRVVGVVVQPGVEFADNSIISYEPEAAKDLVTYAKALEGMVLEGHSTDYQSHAMLTKMREDGIAILKVGPALTFALREAVFSLEAMERILYPFAPDGGYSGFGQALEQKMMKNSGQWNKHYHGSEQTIAYARRYSLSDRCRYYMDDVDIVSALDQLILNIDRIDLPFGMISQYFPAQKERLHAAGGKVTAEQLIKEHIKDLIDTYR